MAMNEFGCLGVWGGGGGGAYTTPTQYTTKLDSAFFRTQSYITKICYFEYLPSLLFGWYKLFFSPIHMKS